MPHLTRVGKLRVTMHCHFLFGRRLPYAEHRLARGLETAEFHGETAFRQVSWRTDEIADMSTGLLTCCHADMPTC